MSERANEIALRLYALKDQPNFLTHAANALVEYGNWRLDTAVREWRSVTNPEWVAEKRNMAALVADITSQLGTEFEELLDKMQERKIDTAQILSTND